MIQVRAFDPAILTPEDLTIARKVLGWDFERGFRGRPLETPDLTISADGQEPYLYRWHLIPRNEVGANVYLHIQVASDPIRPLHDHPWDNQSVILSGGYYEVAEEPCRSGGAVPVLRMRRPGDVVHRVAEDAHRLVLPQHVPYCMTIFSTGPVRRQWGFHASGGWVSGADVTETQDGVSVWKDDAHDAA